MKQKAKQMSLFAVGLLLSIGIDQWTKKLAVMKLKGQSPFVLLDGVFELYYSENRGAAFGMLQGRQGFFFLIAVAVILVTAYLLYKVPSGRKYTPLTICLFLIVSGAVGNMIDRVAQGYVVDFLYFSLIDFPIFNVADCYVTVATGALIFLLLFRYSEEELSFLSFGKADGKGERP